MVIFSKLFCRFTGKDYETDNDDKTEAATTQIDNEKVLESFHFDIQSEIFIHLDLKLI